MPLTFNTRQNPPTYAGQVIRRLLLRGNPFCVPWPLTRRTPPRGPQPRGRTGRRAAPGSLAQFYQHEAESSISSMRIRILQRRLYVQNHPVKAAVIQKCTAQQAVPVSGSPKLRRQQPTFTSSALHLRQTPCRQGSATSSSDHARLLQRLQLLQLHCRMHVQPLTVSYCRQSRPSARCTPDLPPQVCRA